MSELAQRIQDEIKQAMLAKDQLKLGTLRMLKSAIKNLEVADLKKPVTDEAVLGIIRKQMKQREDAASEFDKAQRPELAEKERSEAGILEQYLPKQMDESELRALADKVIQENAISSKKDFGKAMKLIQEAAGGQADNKRISTLLQGVLS